MSWWGVASSVLAPVLLVGGWTAAADLQPVPFDAAPGRATFTCPATDSNSHTFEVVGTPAQ